MVKRLDMLKKESKALDRENKKRIDLRNKLRIERKEERYNLIERFFNTYKENISKIIEENIITSLCRKEDCIVKPEVLFRVLYLTNKDSIRENFMEIYSDIEFSFNHRSFNLELCSKHLCELIADEIKDEYNYIIINDLHSDRVKIKILKSKSKILYAYSYFKIWCEKHKFLNNFFDD